MSSGPSWSRELQRISDHVHEAGLTLSAFERGAQDLGPEPIPGIEVATVRFGVEALAIAAALLGLAREGAATAPSAARAAELVRMIRAQLEASEK